MNVLRQFKFPLLLFLLGILAGIIGAWMKILHMAFADYLLTAAMLLQGVGVAYAIYILVKEKH
jgi:uncharacterized membrane protein